MTKTNNSKEEAIKIYNETYNLYHQGNRYITIKMYDGTTVSGIMHDVTFQGSSTVSPDSLPNKGTIDLIGDEENEINSYGLFLIKELL